MFDNFSPGLLSFQQDGQFTSRSERERALIHEIRDCEKIEGLADAVRRRCGNKTISDSLPG
jgi:hypothetical protein